MNNFLHIDGKEGPLTQNSKLKSNLLCLDCDGYEFTRQPSEI